MFFTLYCTLHLTPSPAALPALWCCSVSRPYNFIKLNAYNTLFDGYTQSLDYLVSFAWNKLNSLKTGEMMIPYQDLH